MGRAMQMLIATSCRKSFDNSNTIRSTVAPITLRILTSFALRSMMKAATPIRPRQEMIRAIRGKTDHQRHLPACRTGTIVPGDRPGNARCEWLGWQAGLPYLFGLCQHFRGLRHIQLNGNIGEVILIQITHAKWLYTLVQGTEIEIPCTYPR